MCFIFQFHSHIRLKSSCKKLLVPESADTAPSLTGTYFNPTYLRRWSFRYVRKEYQEAAGTFLPSLEAQCQSSEASDASLALILHKQ